MIAEMRTVAFGSGLEIRRPPSGLGQEVRRSAPDFSAKCVVRAPHFPSGERRDRRAVVIDKSADSLPTSGRLRHAPDAMLDPQVRSFLSDLWINGLGTRVPNPEVDLRISPSPSRRDGLRDLALYPGAGEQRRSVEIRHPLADLVEKSAAHRPTSGATS